MKNKYDEKGHEIKTYEGYTGYIAPEIKDYFKEKYLAQDIRVVPGHWPSMETKKDVDDWLETLALMNSFFDQSDNEDEDDI